MPDTPNPTPHHMFDDSALRTEFEAKLAKLQTDLLEGFDQARAVAQDFQGEVETFLSDLPALPEAYEVQHKHPERAIKDQLSKLIRAMDVADDLDREAHQLTAAADYVREAVDLYHEQIENLIQEMKQYEV